MLLTACAAALAASAPSAVAAGGTACQLDGNWKVTPGLKLQSALTGLQLTGTASLSDCQGSGGPASGSLYLGGSTITIKGVAYRAPAPAPGSGTCGHPDSPASFGPAPAIVLWDDGTVTVFEFTGLGPWAFAQYYSGQALQGVTLKTVAVDPATGQPSSVNIATTQYAGASVGGASATTSGNQADCVGAGFSTSTVSGKLAFYSTS
jgi:hypothetical protein